MTETARATATPARRRSSGDGRRGRLARASLRRRLAAAFGASVVVVVLIAALCAAGVAGVINARHELLGETDPASLLANQLQLALVNQESNVRGYILSNGDPAYLAGYRRNEAAQASVTRRLTGHLAGDHELLELVRKAEAAGAFWQVNFANPAVLAVASGKASEVTSGRLSAGSHLFTQVHNRFSDLDGALSARRTTSGNRLGSATVTLIVVMSIGFALILLGGIALWRALRVWVLEPVSSLGADARRVTAGELDHLITPRGPPELHQLGSDIEAMRQRIVAELDVVADARAELADRNLDLARSNRELEQFAYVASHDLQEPLRKVTSFTQLLEQRYGDELDERAHQYIDFAVDGATRMQILINDLLTFSRAGHSMDQVGDVDVADVVSRAVRSLAAGIEETGATVETGQLPHVVGEAGLLAQVFQNLIANSVKFRAEEPPRITVTADRRADDWLFAVSDNGIGIDPRFSEKVFVIFQRLHGREAYAGTGIGLALCKKIVEFHGGHIWVDEAYHPGTRLYFTLPAHTENGAHR